MAASVVTRMPRSVTQVTLHADRDGSVSSGPAIVCESD
jgi:hypothetical protein